MENKLKFKQCTTKDQNPHAQAFFKMYPKKSRVAIYSESDIKIILRSYIDLEKGRQKFIFAIRFYNFGRTLTIDLISTPHEFHRKILAEHKRKFNGAPFLCTGGKMKLCSGEYTITGTSSTDYGGSFYGVDYYAVFYETLKFLDIDYKIIDFPRWDRSLIMSLTILMSEKNGTDFYSAFKKEYSERTGKYEQQNWTLEQMIELDQAQSKM